MLVKAPSQWTIGGSPYVNHLSSVIEKVDTNLLVKIDGLRTDLLHAENFGVKTQSIALRRKNIPKEEMISY
jgi:hypothetical protein